MRGVFTYFFLFAVFASWGKPNPDSIAVSKINSKAFKYFLYKPDSAITLANTAIAMAEKKNFTFQAAFGYFVLSKANWAKANYLLSIHYGFKALRIYENTNHIYHWGQCNLAIARTFIDLRNLDQAKTYIDKAFLLASKNHDMRLRAEVYREKSFLLIEQGRYDSALYFSNEGIKLFEARKDTLNASILYGRNTRIYLILKKYKESFVFCKKATLMDSLSNNRRALGITYCMTAEIYYGLHKNDSALIFLKKSIPVNLEIRNLHNMIRTHQLMSKIFEEKGDPINSIRHMKLVSVYKDSLYDRERNGQIQEMLAHYETEGKEKTIRALESENMQARQKARNRELVIIIFAVAVVFLGLLSFLFWRMRQFQAKANTLKSKLFSVISHDLRGPIKNLQALLDLLTKEYITPAEFKEESAKLKSSLNVSQRTLENLLNWSLSQMEGIRTVQTAFNINAVVDDVVHLARETASRKNILIDVKTDGLLLVKADVNQVNLILRNLIHNAIKFSPPQSHVTVQTSRGDRFCTVIIEDLGIGMTNDEVQMILSSNEYFTKPGTDKEKGTGLGLHLCKDFIKRNGGDFSITSKANQGTQVTFTLQLA